MTDRDLVVLDEDDWDDEDLEPEERLTDAELASDIAKLSGELRDLVEEAKTEVLVAPAQEPGQRLLESGEDEDPFEAEERADAAAATSMALSVTSGEDAMTVKKNMAVTRARAAKMQAAIKEKQAQLERLMEHQIERMKQTMLEVVGPMKKMVAVLEEGIWTVNLYLGRDEHIVQLRDGERAPADEPICVRQMVLGMDEETAMAAEDGGIDYSVVRDKDFGAFDEWLLSDPAHIEQIIPERKAVVALVPRFTEKWDPETRKSSYQDEDKETYLLIRNGECLFRIGLKDFEVGNLLVMPANEWAKFFRGRKFNHETREYEEVELTPGSTDWLRAEEKANLRTRHFMRVGLILQGLIDRTTVFHPLPADGVSFLSEESYFSGKVRAILDAENVLGTGRETFAQWQHRLNQELRPGMRIIGSFKAQAFRSLEGKNDWNYGEHNRLHPPKAEKPVSGILYQLEERKGDKLYFRYKRREEVRDETMWRDDPEKPGWGWRGGYREPKVRASCWILRSDTFILAYDLAEVEDMERFLTLRGERHGYLNMFPILKAAIKTKRQEAADEEPFIKMLVGVVAKENGVSIEEAQTAVPDIVKWWKLANRHHRPLLAHEPEQNAKAVRMIVAEHAKRLAEQRRGTARKMADKLLERYPDALIIARKRSSSPVRYVVLSPQSDTNNAWLRKREFDGHGNLKSDEEWTLVEPHVLARWNVIHEALRWERWDRYASRKDLYTDVELDDLYQKVLSRHESDRVLCIRSRDEKVWSGGEKVRQQGWKVYVLDGPAEIDTEHPLTSRPSEPAVTVHSWRCSRGQDGTAKLRDDNSYGRVGNYSRPWGKEPQSWDKEDCILRNADVVAEYEREYVRFKVGLHRHATYNTVKSAAVGSIKEAWKQRAWDEHYSLFIEDYHDPDLWEGHKKTLRVSYPHEGKASTWANSSALDYLVTHLVEADVDLRGMTVRQAVEHPSAPPALVKDGSEYTQIDEDGTSTRHRRVEDYTMPEDLLDLTFDFDKAVGDDLNVDDDAW